MTLYRQMIPEEEEDRRLIDLFNLDPSKIYTFDLETSTASEDNGPTCIQNKGQKDVRFINNNEVYMLKAGEEVQIDMDRKMWVSLRQITRKKLFFYLN